MSTPAITSFHPTATALPRRYLGRNGPAVSVIGLGCMGMSDFYGPRDDAQSLATLRRAIDRGINFIDTADVYGPFTNEELIGRAIAGRREGLVIATKGGILRDPTDPLKRGVDNRPEYLRACCDASLCRLRVDAIDVYYLHRYNPKSAPIEESVGAMAELVRAGKVRYLGLSEVSPATLARAHAVHPIAAVQTEYSLWSREPESDMLAACRRLGVAFVPYSPLGRGFLSGQIKRPEDFAADDFRRELPRFQGENFRRNVELVRALETAAAARGVTAVQLALAWVLAQGDHIVPIPGTRRSEHLDELIEATPITLSRDESAALAAVFPPDAVMGDRYYAAMRPFLGH